MHMKKLAFFFKCTLSTRFPTDTGQQASGHATGVVGFRPKDSFMESLVLRISGKRPAYWLCFFKLTTY